MFFSHTNLSATHELDKLVNLAIDNNSTVTFSAGERGAIVVTFASRQLDDSVDLVMQFASRGLGTLTAGTAS